MLVTASERRISLPFHHLDRYLYDNQLSERIPSSVGSLKQLYTLCGAATPRTLVVEVELIVRCVCECVHVCASVRARVRALLLLL